jgi:hypothetical protein
MINVIFNRKTPSDKGNCEALQSTHTPYSPAKEGISHAKYIAVHRPP